MTPKGAARNNNNNNEAAALQWRLSVFGLLRRSRVIWSPPGETRWEPSLARRRYSEKCMFPTLPGDGGHSGAERETILSVSGHMVVVLVRLRLGASPSDKVIFQRDEVLVWSPLVLISRVIHLPEITRRPTAAGETHQTCTTSRSRALSPRCPRCSRPPPPPCLQMWLNLLRLC